MSKKLKLKIYWTNIKRVIMSILFVNLTFVSKTFATTKPFDSSNPACYGAPSPYGRTDIINFEHVFIILVPIAVIIWILICVKKNKSKKEDNNDKQD